ncbi:hypothetical protein J2X01_003942 [Arthrobacter ginsengisoli]|uniref:Membrane protein ArfC n=1 Tax=Arthrobacter ginsengisoli TaxID=1356565 RepID=A0ABU1UHF8_9MICC|nr:hypothetical protein [Arthrobacter ginsengisoli]MDR7084629.1 hypothetical protein [Arthrobacter ginsengisoli]
MDWIIWLVVIVVIVAIVWWLLKRNSSRSAGKGTAATGTAATDDSAPPQLHDTGRDPTHRGAMSGGGSAASASAAGLAWMPTSAGFSHADPEVGQEPEPDPIATAEDAAVADAHAAARAAALAEAREAEAKGTAAGAAATPAAAGAAASGADVAPAVESPEWETQWSETPPAETHTAPHPEPGHGAQTDHAREAPTAGTAAAAGAPVHHVEYTEPHAPTLPGAESAAAETEVEAGTGAGFDAKAAEGRTAAPTASLQEMPPSQAPAETAAAHAAEPAGHLAVDQPYGEGSAAPAADGSGPEGFTVKGNASSMIYHDETSPAFEETRAEVWFLSPAHAEAAGFRPPRRTRQ